MSVPPEECVAVLLAAGLSSRYPGDKLVAELHGRPLLAHAASTLAAIPFKARIAVVPPDAPGRWERLAELGFAIAVNLAPAEGQGRSLRAGAEAAAAHAPRGVVLALADMPFVPEAHIRALLARLDPDEPRSLAYSLGGGADGGRRSPPAAFGAGWLGELARADGDKGARPIIANALDSQGVLTQAGWLADFDTPADFARSAGRGPSNTLP